MTVFLTNMCDDFATFYRLYAEHFAGEGKPNPTRTTVEVNRRRARVDRATGIGGVAWTSVTVPEELTLRATANAWRR